MESKIKFSWPEVQIAAHNCLEKIKNKGPFAAVVALGRGGAIPAAYIAHQLNIPLEYVNYSRKNGFLDDTISRFPEGTVFLLVDDATETGSTFIAVEQGLPNYEFVTCVLFQSETSSFKPDVIGQMYQLKNPSLPWEN